MVLEGIFFFAPEMLLIPTYSQYKFKSKSLYLPKVEGSCIVEETMVGSSYGKKTYGSRARSPQPLKKLSSASAIILIIVCLFTIYGFGVGLNRTHSIDFVIKQSSSVTTDNSAENESGSSKGPTIRSLNDLSQEELHPKASSHRHIVSPPPDDKPISLVTCETTVGYLHIVVHPSWAPKGAERFLKMVETKYFSSKVALMRCVKGFLCQFGIAGIPEYNKPYNGRKNSLQDDKNWLPEGPTHRTNDLGVKRFGKGYLAYAGGGKNSRSNQFIVALKDNERLGGGSPWEVPWGELVGAESYATLDSIYTGYGEKGPPQGELRREGSSDRIQKIYPRLDYILSCTLVDTR